MTRLAKSISAARLVVLLAIAASASAAQLTEYYNDWATSKEGASVTSPCRTIPDRGIQRILDQVKGEDGCIFADGIEQHEEFTIDLGQQRLLGQVVFINSTATVYGEIKRVPNSLTVSISSTSADGPWKTVYTKDPADITDSFTLDNVPARWLHFDLGVNKDGVGSRVGKVKIFKRYLLKSGPELMKTFYKEFRRDAGGLQDFWKAVDAQNWDAACDAMIEHYSHIPLDPPGDIEPRVNLWMQNKLEDGQCSYDYGSSDWDWLQRKPNCSATSIGLPPGGSTVFALLANAYAKSGDAAYAKQLEALLRDWLQDMPCPGIDRGQDGDLVWGWAGLNASSRTAVFPPILARMFPVKESIFSRDMKINLLYSIWEHLGFLYTITPALGGNWLTNCNGSLFDTALQFPEFVAQKQWLESSKSSFEMSLARDFYPSGKEREDSMMYMPFATGQLFGTYLDIRKAGVSVSKESMDKLSLMYDCMAWMHYPDTSAPTVGDCHRDVLLTKDGSIVNADYLKIYNRPDLLYINTQGKQGTAPAQTSRAFSDGGWYVMRTAWDTKPYEDARQMFFKSSTTRGHGHPDQLEITMYAYGREILTDPGMPAYGQPIESEVHPTSAHSTICIDDQDQSQTSGTERAWVSASGADFADMEFQGYKDITHRRQIVFLKPITGAPDYWLIHDQVTGSGNHKIDLNFHFSADANPKVISGSVCSTYPTGGNALIRQVDQSMQAQLVDSSIALVRSLVPTKTVRYTKQQAPATFDTVLVPFKGPNSPKVDAKALKMDASTEDKSASGSKIATAYGFDVVITSSKPGSKRSFEGGKIRTDASALVIRTNKSGKVIYAFQAGGTSTTYQGKPLLRVAPGSVFAEKAAK